MSPKHTEATSGRRELGEELSRLRRERRYTGNDVALKLGWSPSRISRIEHGLTGIANSRLATLLAFYQVREEVIVRLFELNRVAPDLSRLRPHHELLDDVRLASMHEATATRVTEFEPRAIPTLLQTADYARALLGTGGLVSGEDVGRWLRALEQRQAILGRSYPTLRFFISEHVLRTPVDDKQIMGRQLRRLTSTVSRHECAIRVLPASVGPFGGFDSTFRILEYAASRAVACTQTPTSCVFHEKPEDVSVYRAIHDRLNSLSLDAEQSVQLINDIAITYIGITEHGQSPTGA